MTKTPYTTYPMDEQLSPVVELWDPVVAQEARARLPRPPTDKINKEAYLQDVRGAYHAIGGSARLAHEANQSPQWFFNRFFGRLLPDEHSELDVNITIHPALPRTALDGEFTEVQTDVRHDTDASPANESAGAGPAIDAPALPIAISTSDAGAATDRPARSAANGSAAYASPPSSRDALADAADPAERLAVPDRPARPRRSRRSG